MADTASVVLDGFFVEIIGASATVAAAGFSARGTSGGLSLMGLDVSVGVASAGTLGMCLTSMETPPGRGMMVDAGGFDGPYPLGVTSVIVDCIFFPANLLSPMLA